MNKTPILFFPVMDYSMPLSKVDLTQGYDHSGKTTALVGAGGYMEKRLNMYTSPLFEGKRNIHMGIDIWMLAKSPVFAMADGFVWGIAHNNNDLDYGPTVVLKHTIGDAALYALYGHLSLSSLNLLKEGDKVKAGQTVGYLGQKEENGGWIPHLHFQISTIEPEKPDMPGVVAEVDLLDAIHVYPDPRIFIGPVYI